jgi:UDP-N-acetylmuramoylalanine--D-glutamate ligase
MKPRPPIPEGPYLVVGLARSGLAAARLLSERGEHVIGADAGPLAADAADADAAALADAAPRVELHAHDDGLAHLQRVRAVVKSPGVPAHAPAVAAARARGLPVLGELELAWRLLENQFIAVTGTNGKTTTVELIAHIHRTARLPVALAGNVGVALSGLVARVDPAATIVCEVSSFQLEDALAFAPEAAVLLNITPDHLDRHGTLDAYREAKLRIFARQAAGDVAVLPVETDAVPPSEQVGTLGGASARDVLAPHVELVRFGEGPRAECALREGALWWKDTRLVQVEELRLRGAHNVRNALAAAAVCLARGVDPDAVRAALRTFPGVAHRLQEVARRDGVLYVNDSKATNVASTLVALHAFPDGGVHLILGGQGKGQDFAPLRDAVAGRCRGVYLIGEDAPLLAHALAEAGVATHQCGALERAVRSARAAARGGEVVLLSPACASFDQFTDFEARGDRFVALVSAVGD